MSRRLKCGKSSLGTVPDDSVIRNSPQVSSYRRIEPITRRAFLEEGMLASWHFRDDLCPCKSASYQVDATLPPSGVE
jgi:hypothetical protein